MFGNMKGWISSAVIVVLIAAFVFLNRLHLPPQPKAPTNKYPALFSALTLPVDPSSLAPEMKADFDATPLYREAIEEIANNQKLYGKDGQYRDHRAILIDKPKVVELIIQATHAKPQMTLFSENPKELLSYDSDRLSLTQLAAMGRAMSSAGLSLVNKKKPDEARVYLDAAFTLGYRLYLERVCIEEATEGLELMRQVAGVMKKIEGPQQDAWDEMHHQLDKYEGLKSLYGLVRSLDPAGNATYAGDLFQAAAASKERLWRVEALLAIGRMKFSLPTGHKGSQREAAELPRRYINDPDPIVATAARLADELTIEQFRSMRVIISE